MQAPAWQLSVWVQASPSLQALPLAFAGLEQVPLAGSQTPASWHWSAAAEGTGVVPTRSPRRQTSVCVQPSPSVQGLPLTFTGLEQMPLAGSQTPAPWHWSSAAQGTGLLPAHTPAWQVSVCVQALPSLQAVPLALAGVEQN